jgi:ATP-dependent helicase HrpB
LLAYAFPERIACSRPGNNAQFQLANGTYAAFSHKDELASEQWLTVAQVDARRGTGKIFMAAPLNPKDLAPLVKQKKVISWDTDSGELKASNDLRIGNIVLKSSPLPAPDDEHRVKAISDAVKKEGLDLLNFSEDFEKWKNRVLSLKKWQAQEGWPDVSINSLLLVNHEWLSLHLNDIETPEDLYEIDLMTILPEYFLTPKQKSLMDVLTPIFWQSDNGSKFEIIYSEDGLPPGIVVKVSELSDITKQPMVLDNNVSIGIQVLDESGKPIYLIHELASFWESEYPKLKSEWEGK